MFRVRDGLTLVPLARHLSVLGWRVHHCLCARTPILCLLIDGLNLNDDPMFANQWDKEQWQAGKEKFRSIFAAKTRKEWCDQFEGTDVCFAPVLNFSEALEHPHNVARETFLPETGLPSQARTEAQCNAGCGRHSTDTGTHTAEVLEALDLDSETLKKLVG